MRGSVEKRGNTWRFCIYCGYVDGKRKYIKRGGFSTKRAAEQAMRETIRSLELGTYVEPSKQTVAEYMEEWLSSKEYELRYNTLRQYRWLISRHIVPHIGYIQLQKLTAQHLRMMYTSLLSGDKPLSRRSVVHLHHLLHGAFDEAVRMDLISRNPVDGVKPPRVDQYEFQVWTPEELQKFLAEAQKERYYIAFLLLGVTGCRKAEILGLRWSDVDLDNGKLHIRTTLVEKQNGLRELESTKTHRSRRPVTLDPYTVEELRKHRIRQREERLRMGVHYQDNDLVICREDGTPVPYGTLHKQWVRIIERAGVPRIRIHDLRHSHATMLFQQGVATKLVADRLGHSRTAVTLDIYTHVIAEQQEEVADLVGEVLFGEGRLRKKHGAGD